MPNLQSVIGRILETRSNVPANRSALVAITGIDGSGKGYLTAKIASALQTQRLRVATINIDGWLNLPHIRFNKTNPAEHFYLHAIRFEDMFAQLVIPLRDRSSVRIEMDYAEEGLITDRSWLFSTSLAALFHILEVRRNVFTVNACGSAMVRNTSAC